MASECGLTHDATGVTVYFTVRRSSDSKIWNTAGTPAFETYATANITDYDVACTEQGTASRYYVGTFPTGITTAGLYYVNYFERAGASPAEGDLCIGVQTIDWSGTAVTGSYSLSDVYHATIATTLDDTDTLDMYTVVWFKNGVRITSGITSPTIQLIKRSDGTDLLASTAMSQIGTTGAYKYDSASRISAATNENVVAVVSATIDSATRTFATVIIRDRTAA